MDALDALAGELKQILVCTELLGGVGGTKRVILIVVQCWDDPVSYCVGLKLVWGWKGGRRKGAASFSVTFVVAISGSLCPKPGIDCVLLHRTSS